MDKPQVIRACFPLTIPPGYSSTICSGGHRKLVVGEEDCAEIRGDIAIGWLPAEPPKRERAIILIARAVLQLRLFRGWTQLDVEHRSGVDQTTISRLEGGLQEGLSIVRLARILDALLVGDVRCPPANTVAPTPLELMIFGDTWKRAGDRAARRIDRRRRRHEDKRAA